MESQWLQIRQANAHLNEVWAAEAITGADSLALAKLARDSALDAAMQYVETWWSSPTGRHACTTTTVRERRERAEAMTIGTQEISEQVRVTEIRLPLRGGVARP